MRPTSAIVLAFMLLLVGCKGTGGSPPARATCLGVGQQAILAALSSDSAAWRVEEVNGLEVVVFRTATGLAGMAYIKPESREVVSVLVPTHENLDNALTRARAFLEKKGWTWGDPSSIEFGGTSFRFGYSTPEGEMRLVGPRRLEVPLLAGEPREIPRR